MIHIQTHLKTHLQNWFLGFLILCVFKLCYLMLVLCPLIILDVQHFCANRCVSVVFLSSQRLCVLVLQSLKMLDNEETTDNELRTKFSQRWSRTPSGDLYKPLRTGMPRKIVALICCWCWAFLNFLFIYWGHYTLSALQKNNRKFLIYWTQTCRASLCAVKSPLLVPLILSLHRGR